MIPRIRTFTIALSLIALTAMPTYLSAQSSGEKSNHRPRYKLIDLGTLGGNNSFVATGPPLLMLLNNRGSVVGSADTSTPDPYAPYCIFDCFVTHAFQWTAGVQTDLGALPGVNGSVPIGINELGVIAGVSENGSIEPATNAPEYDAVVWKQGIITDLGTFGGKDSLAFAINDWNEVVGWALNTIPDNYTYGLGPCTTLDCFPVTTQIRAFLWQNGRMQDLGTLGGNDASATLINDLGMIGGQSYTNTTPNPTTGLPTQDPFLWVNGRMLDVGTLGGTYGYPNWLNVWGQVVGQSNLAGDQTYHPFLWSGRELKDLGTFGGPSGSANWVNDKGEVVGYADFPGGPCTGLLCVHHGFLWKQGSLKDLGTVGTDPCSRAYSINLSGQVVGESAPVCGGEITEGFLWENGTMYDLNTLIPAGSNLQLTEGLDINDRGEITGGAVLPNGDEHAFLLIPADQNSDQDDAAATASQDSFVVSANAKMPTPRVSKGSLTRLGDGRSANRFARLVPQSTPKN